MILTFNALGVIISTDTTDEALRQGNVGNTLKAIFQGKNNLNYTANIAFTRSDGQHISGIQLTPDATDLTKFVYEFDDPWFFAKDGETTCTINLVNAAGTVVVTGQFTFDIEKTDFSDDDPEITVTQYNSIMSTLALKLNIQSGIVAIANKSDIVITEYADGQVFYVKNEQKLYCNNNGVLALYSNNIGIIETSGLYDGATLNKDYIALPVCYIIHTNTGMVYRKIKTTGSAAKFANEFDFIDGNNTQNDTLGRVTFDVNLSTGVISNSTIYSKRIYNKDQIDTQFYNKDNSDARFVHLTGNEDVAGLKTFLNGIKIVGNITDGTFSVAVADIVDIGSNQSITGLKRFDVELPESTKTPTDNADLTPKNYVDGLTGSVPSGKTLQGQINDILNTELPKYIPLNQKGVLNGVATLDGNAKVPISQIPDAVLGQVEYCDDFDASSSTDQTIRTPRKGDYYICDTAGTHNPDGTQNSPALDYEVGDWAIYNGTVWKKVDNTDAVQSVNGQKGAVQLDGTNLEMGGGDSTKLKTAINDKLGITDAENTYQTKYIAYTLTIQTSDWNPSTRKAIFSNLYEQLGAVLNVDVTNQAYDETNYALSKTFGVELEGVTTSGSTTTATFSCMTIPTDNIQVTILVVKVNYGVHGQSGVLSTDDIDDSTIKIVNSKLAVNPTKVTEWDAKQDALTIDNAPTNNSNNPISSGGVYTALETKQGKLYKHVIQWTEQVYYGCIVLINNNPTPITSLSDTAWYGYLTSALKANIGTRILSAGQVVQALHPIVDYKYGGSSGSYFYFHEESSDSLVTVSAIAGTTNTTDLVDTVTEY